MSAPVFRNVMEGALRLMDVSPDNLPAWLAAQEEAEAKRLKAQGINTTTATATALGAGAVSR